jgi:maltooligosyltrehalose trehalohydrolase
MAEKSWRLERGATWRAVDEAVHFSVWAPRARQIVVRVLEPACSVLMERHDNGLHSAFVSGIQPGSQYFYILDVERSRPDPVSRFQPHGVHGPSAIVAPDDFAWTDQNWRGLSLAELLIYELHTGTFSAEGTFPAIIPYLDYLKNELGITAVELMPVAEFPGGRNWGYDGVHPYAPHSVYGGPLGLKTLVNACHERGLAVMLDVVYNHLGPEGNYLHEYGPYFTDRYHTPWGQAVNFDGEDSGEVRRYFIDNALYWVTEYHIDALRLDAIQGIFDESPKHILQELTEAVHAQANALGRTIVVIAESDLNDAQVITERAKGGWGLDAQWSDDFHHALHALLTGERASYYQDFGRLTDLATAITDGFVYQGQASAFRHRPHGSPSRHLPGERFVVYSQNHDQVGNRAQGERLSMLLPFPALKLAAGLVLCAPNIPLLFMGEEYGETAPFLYFTSHTDPALAQAVREGRRREFAAFTEGQAVPDPQELETFHRSRLHHELRMRNRHRALLRWYHDLIALRKHSVTLRACDREYLRATPLAARQVLTIHRWLPNEEEFLLLLSFAARPVSFCCPPLSHDWRKVLDSEDLYYGGDGKGGAPLTLSCAEHTGITLDPFMFVVYRHSKIED